WYDLMVRHGVPEGTEIQIYADERPASMTAMLVQAVPGEAGRNLTSLTNAHSLEHGLLYWADAEGAAGLSQILTEIFTERPDWDCLKLFELDPRDPSYVTLTDALRHAGLLVAQSFNSGTWYEDTATWRRARRSCSTPGAASAAASTAAGV